MNHLLYLALLAAPCVDAMAAYMASVPQEIRSLVDTHSCELPDEFIIRNFTAQSADRGETLTSFDFGFHDNSTEIQTSCSFNSTSEPIIEGGRTPRFPCDDARVQFIWQNASLTMIEKVCPGEDGAASYEASGTAPVELVCGGGSNTTTAKDCEKGSGCHASSKEILARFFSIQPVPSAES